MQNIALCRESSDCFTSAWGFLFGGTMYAMIFGGRYKITTDAHVYNVLTGKELKQTISRSKTSFHKMVSIRIDGKRKLYYVHRLLMHAFYNFDISSKNVVDHINGNGLDNSLQNLRVCTQHENLQNHRLSRNGRKYGTWYSKDHKKWVTCLQKDGIRKFLGRFDTEEEAHSVYINAFNNL